MDVNINANENIATKYNSYFDGGLLQLIGWSISGDVIVLPMYI